MDRYPYYDEEYELLYRKTGDRIRYCVAQNTDEWKRLRCGSNKLCIGASSVASLIGIGYDTPQEAFKKLYMRAHESIYSEELAEIEQEMSESEPVQHGNRYEDLTGDVHECITGRKTYKGYMWRLKSWFPCNDPWGRFAASPDRSILFNPILKELDGYYPNSKIEAVVELKSPFGSLYDNVPEDHIAQMQYQCLCSDTAYAEYAACKIVHQGELNGMAIEALIARVWRSKPYIKWMKHYLEKASNCLYDGKPPSWGRQAFYDIPRCKVEIIYKGPLVPVLWQQNKAPSIIHGNSYTPPSW